MLTLVWYLQVVFRYYKLSKVSESGDENPESTNVNAMNPRMLRRLRLAPGGLAFQAWWYGREPNSECPLLTAAATSRYQTHYSVLASLHCRQYARSSQHRHLSQPLSQVLCCYIKFVLVR